MIKKRDEHYGVSAADKRKLRESYLPEYKPRAEADHWLKSGKVRVETELHLLTTALTFRHLHPH